MFFNKIKKDYLYSMKIDKSAYREFRDANESSEWGKKIYKQWAENYKETSKKVKSVDVPSCCESPIESYCGYNYQITNKNLRAPNVNKTNEEHYVLIREICSAPLIPENIVVYRLVCDEVIQRRLTTIRDETLVVLSHKKPDGYFNVKVEFGEGQLSHLSEEISNYGKKVLLVYGGDSIKKIGLYDKVINELNESDIKVYELSGVEPNPRLKTVNSGSDICKREGIDVVLAVGGGSTIDCAKAIAADAYYNGDCWDLVTYKAPITKALPDTIYLTEKSAVVFTLFKVPLPKL